MQVTKFYSADKRKKKYSFFFFFTTIELLSKIRISGACVWDIYVRDPNISYEMLLFKI